MSKLGKLYRKVAELKEPALIPESAEIAADSMLSGRSVLLLGDQRLIPIAAQIVVSSGAEKENLDFSGKTEEGTASRHSAAIICSALPPVFLSEGAGGLNDEIFSELKRLYFLNQMAAKALVGEGATILNLAVSSGEQFWLDEIEGLTSGVAMALAPLRQSVNSIHVTVDKREALSASAALGGIEGQIALWSSCASAMSTGNVLRVVREANK